MRHLGSGLLALLVAPLALVLAGRGLGGLAEAAAAARPDHFVTSTAAAATGLAGLLYALLVMVRFSPLGPALAGLGYLTVGIWALADPDGFAASLRDRRVDLIDLDAELVAGAQVAPLLAVPLLLTLVSGTRWRGQMSRFRDTRAAQSEATLHQPPPPAPYLQAPPPPAPSDDPTLPMPPVTATPPPPAPSSGDPPPATDERDRGTELLASEPPTEPPTERIGTAAEPEPREQP